MEKKFIFTGVLIVIIIVLASFVILKKPKEEKEYFYLLELNYNKGEISLLNLILNEGHADKPLFEPEDGWRVEFLSFKNEVLFSYKFHPNLADILWIEPKPGEEVPEGEREPVDDIYLENADFTLPLPYFKEGKTINIYNPEEELKFSVDASKISK